MAYKVGVISEALALEINEGFIDDDKNAFQSADGAEFYAKESYLGNLKEEDFTVAFLSQTQVDGTLPVVKRLRVYP